MAIRQPSFHLEIQAGIPSPRDVFFLTTLVSLSSQIFQLLFSYISSSIYTPLSGVIMMRGYSVGPFVSNHWSKETRFCRWYDFLITCARHQLLGRWIPPMHHLLITACLGILDSCARSIPLSSISRLRWAETIYSNGPRLSNKWIYSLRLVCCSWFV